ncbi:hypothetical protein CBL_08148, partial [Carabus blaptoides fortunei]
AYKLIGMWRYVCAMMALATLGNAAVAVRASVPCEEARLKCAYRTGCGRALQNYLMGCSAVLQGPPSSTCPENCQHALIALTSTDEGKDLMTCECSDEFCGESKKRVEVCRPQVIIANMNDTVVSCRVAQWICAADALCSTALDYYNRYCRLMFLGKKCTHRCMNSISILRRQEKAAKLSTCQCDGYEPYDCPQIQNNMARLCFHTTVIDDNTIKVMDTPVEPPNAAATLPVVTASYLATMILLLAVT